ncbi:protein-tyrosine phosphatase-like protein [Mycena floridula]|nr:protein-tyrosine phosphatase-like protein [Mycena floridula]
MTQWKNMSAIIENRLFVGNLSVARSSRYLFDNRISHVVSVCLEPIPSEMPLSGMRHLRIPIEDVDYQDLLIHLPSAVEFIDQALRNGGNVLIHCGEGLSRAPAVAAAYVMWARRMDATRALQFVRSAHEQSWPNAGFQEQLVLFELCQYRPGPSNSIYMNWRTQLDRSLRRAGLR